ncbi:hypothetical protein F5144DRAFT_478360, partial [Chaetomium tenue]
VSARTGSVVRAQNLLQCVGGETGSASDCSRAADPMEIGAISSNTITPVPGREYLADAEVEPIFGRKRD